MDGDAVALRNKADNLVAGHGRAAAGEFDHAGVDVLDDDARVLMAARLDGGWLERFRRLLLLILAVRAGEIVADASERLRRR